MRPRAPLFVALLLSGLALIHSACGRGEPPPAPVALPSQSPSPTTAANTEPAPATAPAHGTAAPAPAPAPVAPPVTAAPVSTPATAPAPPAAKVAAPAAKTVDPGGEVAVKVGLTRTGPGVCKLCHKIQFASWSASAHAKRTPPVDCESCHGPGSEYKSMAVMKDPIKAKAAGLVDPGAAFCATCHKQGWSDGMRKKAHAHKA